MTGGPPPMPSCAWNRGQAQAREHIRRTPCSEPTNTHAVGQSSFGSSRWSASAAEFTSALPLCDARWSAVATAASSATTLSGKISNSVSRPVMASSGRIAFSPASSVCSATMCLRCVSALAARFLATQAP